MQDYLIDYLHLPAVNAGCRRTPSDAVAIPSTWLLSSSSGQGGRRSASKPGAGSHSNHNLNAASRPTQAYRIEPGAGRYDTRLTTNRRSRFASTSKDRVKACRATIGNRCHQTLMEFRE